MRRRRPASLGLTVVFARGGHALTVCGCCLELWQEMLAEWAFCRLPAGLPGSCRHELELQT